MQKISFILWLLLLFSHWGMAQKATSVSHQQDSSALKAQVSSIISYAALNIDSALIMIDDLFIQLEQQKKNTTNKKKIRLYANVYLSILSTKSTLLTSIGKPEEGFLLAQKARVMFEQSPDQYQALPKIYSNLANIHSNIGNVDSAVFFYQKAIDLAKESNNSASYAHGVNSLAGFYIDQGKFVQALKLQQEALTLYHQLNDIEGIASSKYSIGNIYLDLDDYPKAEDYFKQAIQHLEGTKHIRGLAAVYSSLGSVYQHQKNFKNANLYFDKSFKLVQQAGDQFSALFLFIKKAEMNANMGNYQAAVDSLEKVLPFFQENNLYRHTLHSLTTLMHIQEKLNKTADAIIAAEQALNLIEELEADELRETVVSQLVHLYSKTNRYEDAFRAQSLHLSIKDSIINSKRDRSIIQLEEAYKYQVQQAKDSTKNAAIQQIKDAELSAQQQRINYLLIGFIIVLLLGGFAFNRYLVTQKQKNKITEQNSEKELLLKEIHHRVKNNLQIISSLLDLQSKRIDDATTSAAITDGQNRVKSMALIHQKLYQNDNIAAVDFGSYVEQLLEQLLSIYKIKKVNKNIDIPEGTSFDIDTAIPLGLMLNELFTNSCKYAFNNERTNEISIQLSTIAKGSYALDVKDNGKGLPDNFDIWEAESLGLRLVGRLSEQLFGEVHYHTENGAHFKIEFKDTELRKEMD